MAIDSHGTGRAGTKELGLCWCTRMLPCSVQSPKSPKAASINYVPIPWLFFLISSEKITRLEHNSLSDLEQILVAPSPPLPWAKLHSLCTEPCSSEDAALQCCQMNTAALGPQQRCCSAAKQEEDATVPGTPESCESSAGSGHVSLPGLLCADKQADAKHRTAITRCMDPRLSLPTSSGSEAQENFLLENSGCPHPN